MMHRVGKIIGFPVKLFGNHRLYIPMEYLRYYGISHTHDKLLISKSERGLFYRPLPKDGTEYAKNNIVSIRGGLFSLPVDWVRQNELRRGDTLFMLGTADGLLIYVRNSKF